MSGGQWDYKQNQLGYLANEIEHTFKDQGKYIDKDYDIPLPWNGKRPDKKHDYLEGITEEDRKKVLFEVLDIVTQLRNLELRIKNLDWYLSRDDSLETYLKELK